MTAPRVTAPLTVLTIEDESLVRESITLYFEDSGFRVLEAAEGQTGLAIFRREQPDVVLTDLRMPGLDGLAVIATLQTESPETPVIAVSGTGRLDDAIEAVRRGAWDYVTKPVPDLATLELTVKRALERARLLRENRAYREHLEQLVQERTASLEQEIAERKRAEEELRRDAERSAALARAAAGLNASFGLPEVLNTVCEQVARALEAPVTMIWLAGEDPHPIPLRAAFGLSPEVYSRFRPLRNRVLPQYQKRGEHMYYLSDTQLVHDSPNLALFQELGLHTVVICRLYYQEQFVGLLTVFRHDVDSPFSEADLTMLDILRNQIAIAIHHAQLFEQVKIGRERLQAMSERLVEIQEAERRHLAIELHDEIGQALTHIKMSLDRFDPAHPEKGNLESAQAMMADLMQRVRSLSLELRPTILDDLGLVPAVLWHLERYTAVTGIPVEFKPSGADRRFSALVESTTYRVLQESLTNIARHAGATQVTVSLWADEERLGLQVEDNGVGFDPAVIAPQLTGGLSGMQERAKICGGQLLIDSQPGQGTYLSLELPVRGEWVERRAR